MPFKNLLSFELKIRILLFLMKFKKNRFFKASDLGTRRKIFIFLTADYGNLGDVAISYAQADFVKRNFPEFEIVDVPISQTVEGIHFTLQNIKKGDLIGINGGGNFGDLYVDIETLRQLVVKFFPDHKIIGFPMTVDYSEEEHGRKSLQKAQSRYRKHKSLVLMARERRSFEAMKRMFPENQVFLSPDIVMSLNKRLPETQRKGVVVCLRNDIEKRLNKDEDAILYSLIDTHFGSHNGYDTHIGRGHLSMNERVDELEKIWQAFRGAELVLTDRLHGMIFCFITGTPCLVFLNNNHKIQDSYEWIKAADYISLISDFSKEKVEELFMHYKAATFSGSPVQLSDKYQNLINAIH